MQHSFSLFLSHHRSSQQLPTELLQLNNFEVDLKNPTSCMRNYMPVIFFFPPPAPGIFYLNLPAKTESGKELGLMALPGLLPFKGKQEKLCFFFQKQALKSSHGNFPLEKKKAYSPEIHLKRSSGRFSSGKCPCRALERDGLQTNPLHDSLNLSPAEIPPASQPC